MPMAADGTLWLLAGRPGMGKTALARCVVRRVREQGRAAYFTAEDMPMTVNGIEGFLMTWGGADLIVIDELRDLREYRRGTAGEIPRLLAQLKVLSAQTGSPVLLLSGLSRRVEYRRDHVPRLTDIPRWTDLSTWLDGAALLYRAAYYDPQADRTSARCLIARRPFRMMVPIELHWDDSACTFDTE